MENCIELDVKQFYYNIFVKCSNYFYVYIYLCISINNYYNINFEHFYFIKKINTVRLMKYKFTLIYIYNQCLLFTLSITFSFITI